MISLKLQSKFIETTLRHGCSSVTLLHHFTIPFPKNTYGGLLLSRQEIKLKTVLSVNHFGKVIHHHHQGETYYLNLICEGVYFQQQTTDFKHRCKKQISNIHVLIHPYLEKQPLEMFYEKRCSKKFCKVYRKTPVPQSLF